MDERGIEWPAVRPSSDLIQADDVPVVPSLTVKTARQDGGRERISFESRYVDVCLGLETSLVHDHEPAILDVAQRRYSPTDNTESEQP